MGQHLLVGFDAGFLPIFFQRQAESRARRADPGRAVKIPDIARRVIEKAIAQLDRQHVFALKQMLRQVIAVVIDQIIRRTDIRREKTLGQVRAVEPNLVKAKAGDHQLRLRARGRNELPAEKRRRNILRTGRILRPCVEKRTGKVHMKDSLPCLAFFVSMFCICCSGAFFLPCARRKGAIY